MNRFFRVNDFAAFLGAGFDIQLPRNSVGFPDENLFSPSAGIGMEYNIGRISPFVKFDRRFIFSNTYFFDGGIKFRI